MAATAVVAVLLLVWHGAAADDQDLFSSTFELKRLLLAELEFAGEIQRYADALEAKAVQVRHAVNALYAKGPLRVEDPEAYVAHPLNALGVMRRLGRDAQQLGLGEMLSSDAGEESRQKALNATAIFPTFDEYVQAQSSITLLREAYDLNQSEFSSGVIHAGGKLYHSDHVPSWMELANLGTESCNRGWWDTGLTWIELALQRYPGGDHENKEFKEFSLQYEEGKRMHDKILDKRGAISAVHRTFPIPFDPKLKKKKKYKKNKNSIEEHRKARLVPLFSSGAPSSASLSENFHSLCKEGSSAFRTPALDAENKCFLLHHGNPYLRLGPFKLEELSKEPFIVLFHDFMFESETDYYVATASKRLERSRTALSNEGNSRANLVRTSKQFWLSDIIFDFNGTRYIAPETTVIPQIPSEPHKHRVVLDAKAYGVSLRIGRATTLAVDGPFSAEPFQVANYGMGGQYGSHIDPHSYIEKVTEMGSEAERTEVVHAALMGDRIGTFMAYLSDVEFGGATVFPLTGNVAYPKKGSAVFWINLKSDSSHDPLTWHGGCPVLIGSKWITNKWLQSNDNFHTFPCDTKPEQRYDLSRNMVAKVAFVIATLWLLVNAEDSVGPTADVLKAKVKNQLKSVQKQLKALDYFLDTYYKDYNFTEADAHEYVSNPINAYMLIKRTSLEWPSVKNVLFDDAAESEMQEILELVTKMEL